MDYLVDRIKVETDAPVRSRMLTEALQLSNDTVSHIPLHDQVIPWAMKERGDDPPRRQPRRHACCEGELRYCGEDRG